MKQPGKPRKLEDPELLRRLSLVFRDYGYEGTSLSRISEATGLERASLYHRFPGGKEEMAQAVVRYVGELFHHEVLAALLDVKRGASAQALRGAVETAARQLGIFYEDGGRPCVLDSLSLQAGGDGLQALVGESYRAWQRVFASVSMRAGLSGSESQARARQAIMAIHGSLVLARATGNRGPFREVLAKLPETLLAAKAD
ncbi:MAG: TetR/AcrR family transcriptional regulator [Acidobacteriota bacterium]